MKKIISKFAFGTIFILINISEVFAQSNGTVPPLNPTDQKILLPGTAASDQGQYLQGTFLPSVTTTVINLTGGLSLLFVILAGIQIIAGYGNEERVTAAKKTLIWAIVGLLISILSYAIVQIITSIQIFPGLPKK